MTKLGVFAFHPDDRVWLCLTTLRHRRFVEDAVHLVGMPEGAHVRLRYRKPYVDSDLWQAVGGGQFSTARVRLVVALGGADNGTDQVTPLRVCNLAAISCEGSVLVLDVVLGEFLSELFPAGDFWKEVRSFAKNLPSSFSYESQTGGVYLQELQRAPSTLLASHGVGAWEHAAKEFFRFDAMSGSDAHRCTPFLYYIDGLTRGLQDRLSRSGAIEVEAGGNISLRVHTIARPGTGLINHPLGEVQVDLAHGSAKLTSSRRVRVDSTRDVRIVSVATSALFRRTYGHLSIRMIEFRYKPEGEVSSQAGQARARSAEQRDEVVISRYDYPMRVGRFRPWIASGMVALAAAIAVFDLPSDRLLELSDLLLPAATFALAFFGLILGLRKEGGD